MQFEKTLTVLSNTARYNVKFWLRLNFLQALLKLFFETNCIIGVEESLLQNQLPVIVQLLSAVYHKLRICQL